MEKRLGMSIWISQLKRRTPSKDFNHGLRMNSPTSMFLAYFYIHFMSYLRTNLLVHSGLREDPERVLGYLIKLAQGDHGTNR